MGRQQRRGRLDLTASPIDWSAALEAVSGRAKPTIEPASPREPEQTAALDDIVTALKKQRRVQLVMACGTGKTLVTRWITEARKDRLVLVLVPTLLLLKLGTAQRSGASSGSLRRHRGPGRPSPRSSRPGTSSRTLTPYGAEEISP